MPFSVALTADTLPIPDGYVVPERGNVTFTCSSSSGGALFWTVDLRIQGGTATFTTSAGISSGLPNVSSPDTNNPTANPASFTIHYIAPESNRSTVECSDFQGRMLISSSATIIVEGKKFYIFHSSPDDLLQLCSVGMHVKLPIYNYSV